MTHWALQKIDGHETSLGPASETEDLMPLEDLHTQAHSKLQPYITLQYWKAGSTHKGEQQNTLPKK